MLYAQKRFTCLLFPPVVFSILHLLEASDLTVYPCTVTELHPPLPFKPFNTFIILNSPLMRSDNYLQIAKHTVSYSVYVSIYLYMCI